MTTSTVQDDLHGAENAAAPTTTTGGAEAYELRDTVTVRTEPFTLETPRGTLRGLIQSDPTATACRGTVVVAPAFGVAMRRGQGVALYFLLNGFDVVRYDPTNHVGISDGDITALTPSSMVEDLITVMAWAGGSGRRGPLGLFASSISARLAFTVLAERDWGLGAVGTISSVVNMGTSIAAAKGDDIVGRCVAGGADWDPDAIEPVMEHDICCRFIQDLVDRGWHTTESTAADVAQLGSLPLISVHGAKDEWVDVEEARKVLGEHGGATMVVLSDAVHSLNPASARTAMTEIVRFFNDPAGPRTGPVNAPDITQVLEQSKSEGRLEQRADAPPFVEAVHRGLLKNPHGDQVPAS